MGLAKLEEDVCIGGENAAKIVGLRDDIHSWSHQTADVARTQMEFKKEVREDIVKINDTISKNGADYQRGLVEIGHLFTEIKEILTGNMKKKGLMHEVKDTKEKLSNYEKENNKYKDKIDFCHDICKNIHAGLGIGVSTIIRTLANLATTGICAAVLWKVITK